MSNKKGGITSAILTGLSVLCGLGSIFIAVYLLSLLWDNAANKIILPLGILVCILKIAKAVFYALALWTAHKFAYSSLLEIRLAMIDHLRKLPLSFFQKRKTGDLANVIDHDVERIELYLAHTLPDVVITNIICVSIFIILTILDWRLGIALVSTVPLVFLLLPLFGRMWQVSVKNYQDSIKTVSENIMEYIGSISAIKAFSNDETKTNKVLESMYAYVGNAKKAIYNQTIPMSFITLLMEAGIVATAIVASIILKSGPVTAWGVIVFILSIILAGQFLKNFSKSMSLHYNKIVYKNTLSMIDSIMGELAPQEKERVDGLKTGDIQFNTVSFAYKTGETVLNDIELNFCTNTINAIVGPSGAGKSTIAALIMNLWEPSQGTVTIGNTNVADIHEQDLAAMVSMVQQDTFLFNGSIEENIKLGKENADNEEVIEAAKKARIHDTIIKLPNGYKTNAGEAGSKLSGGERQRISLARMILKNAPIIILDEATAAIDPYNEQLIQQAINELCKEKTLIIIAHHLNIIMSADQIIVMQDGKILAKGTHTTLLQENKLYSQLCETEQKAAIWNMKG
ncbi:ABC transporter ATP-binding protein/permease [Treponema primitia]|uniref:ABC transporter ATP-binding protein n=1 Tax=Treponema primitia TaxID=88058 RepID=UPI0039817C82